MEGFSRVQDSMSKGEQSYTKSKTCRERLPQVERKLRARSILREKEAQRTIFSFGAWTFLHIPPSSQHLIVISAPTRLQDLSGHFLPFNNGPAGTIMENVQRHAYEISPHHRESHARTCLSILDALIAQLFSDLECIDKKRARLKLAATRLLLLSSKLLLPPFWLLCLLSELLSSSHLFPNE